MKNELSFITADDHSVITKSLAFILKDLYKDAIVYQLNTLGDVVEVLQSATIHLLVLDISFPDGDSIGVMPSLIKKYPGLKILIFSGHEEDLYAIRCVNAGANGYLSKLSTEEEIKNAISEVMCSGKYFSKKIQEKIQKNYIFKKPINLLEQLSNREFEIANLMVKGYGNLEICNALNLKKSTVGTYRNRIFEKLEVSNISALIQLFNLYEK